MKKRLLLFILAICSFCANAQEVALTKAETINYISKKLNQSIDYEYNSYYITGISISLDSEGNVVYYTDYKTVKDGACYQASQCPSSFKRWEAHCSFNPMHITNIEEVTTTGSVGILRVNLVPKTGKVTTTTTERSCEEQYRSVYSYTDIWGNAQYENRFEGYKAYCNDNKNDYKSDSIDFVFLKADTTNYGKLVKAFNHLASLAKAEDDPFGE